MNLKILFIIIVYYAFWVIFLLLGSPVFNSNTGYTSSIDLNQSSPLTSSEVDTGGLFGTGVDFGRFFGILLFGIGLNPSLPSWFLTMFALWQTIVTILSVGFVISSIWNG